MKTKVRPKKFQSLLLNFFSTQRSSSSSPVKRKIKLEPNSSQTKQNEKINKTQPEPSNKRFKINDPVSPEAATRSTNNSGIPTKKTSQIPGTPKKATSTNKNERIWLSKLEYAEINDA